MSTQPVCKCFEQDCSVCLNYSVDYCPSSPVLITTSNLLNNTTYYLWITDKLRNIYNSSFNTGSSSDIIIDLGDFPVGMFVHNFGAINIFLSTDSDGLNVQPITIDTVSYNCIIFSVNQPVYLSPDNDCDLLTSDDGIILIAQ